MGGGIQETQHHSNSGMESQQKNNPYKYIYFTILLNNYLQEALEKWCYVSLARTVPFLSEYFFADSQHYIKNNVVNNIARQNVRYNNTKEERKKEEKKLMDS